MENTSNLFFSFDELSGIENLIFFDLGSNLGEVTDRVVSVNPDAVVHMFDPLASFSDPHGNVYEDLDLRLKKWNESKIKLKFHQKAAWVYDGEVLLAKGNKTCHTNSKIQEILEKHPDHRKTKYHKDRIVVPCVNIMRFIDQKTKRKNFCVVKMDIEGAEYEVLSRFESNAKVFKKIDVLLIETHDAPNQELSFLEIFKEMKRVNKELRIYSEDGIRRYRRVFQ